MELAKKRMRDPLIVYALIDNGESVSEAACLYPRIGELYLYHIKTPKKKHHRKGYASKVLKYMQDDPMVGTILTGWSQSTPEGRRLCEKCGFKREKDWLVWRNDKKLKEIYNGVQNALRQGRSEAGDKAGGVHEGGEALPEAGHVKKVFSSPGSSEGSEGE